MTKHSQIIINLVIGVSTACGLLALLLCFFLLPRALFALNYEIPPMIIHLQAWFARDFKLTEQVLEWGPVIFLFVQAVLFLGLAYLMNKILKVKEPGLHGLGLPDEGDLVKSEVQEEWENHDVSAGVLILFVGIFFVLVYFGLNPYFV